MTTILVDHVSAISVHSGVVRVACTTVAADGTVQPSGTLLIPAATAGPILTALVNAMRDLAAQHNAKVTEDAGKPQ